MPCYAGRNACLTTKPEGFEPTTLVTELALRLLHCPRLHTGCLHDERQSYRAVTYELGLS